MIPAIIAAVGAASGIAGGVAGMFAQNTANKEINRRFKLDSDQQVGQATAAAAAAGADTYGGPNDSNASPSTTNFIDSMRAEFARQGEQMKRVQKQEMLAKGLGLLAGGAGAAANIASSSMAANKVGSTFTPGLGSSGSFSAGSGFNFSSQLQGPNWGR
jgi:hypothetical protein